MKRIKSILVTIALAATLLSGLALQGMGAASLANVAASHHAVSGKSVAFIRPPCGSASDC